MYCRNWESRGLKHILAAPERRADELIVLAGAARPEPVARLAVAVLTALAEEEGQVPGVPADQVHLHELGGVDTLVDTVGVAAAVCALGVTAVWSAPLALGSGSVTMAHGRYPRAGARHAGTCPRPVIGRSGSLSFRQAGRTPNRRSSGTSRHTRRSSRSPSRTGTGTTSLTGFHNR